MAGRGPFVGLRHWRHHVVLRSVHNRESLCMGAFAEPGRKRAGLRIQRKVPQSLKFEEPS